MDKKQCRHLNCAVREFGIVAQSWTVSDGKIDDEGYFSEPDLMDTLHVECRDCGLDRIYYKQRLPKWLQSHYDWIAGEKYDKYNK